MSGQPRSKKAGHARPVLSRPVFYERFHHSTGIPESNPNTPGTHSYPPKFSVSSTQRSSLARSQMHTQGSSSSGWPISSPWVGRKVACSRHTQAHYHTLRRLLSLFDIDLSRMKSNCSTESNIYALSLVQCLPLWPWPCLCTNSLGHGSRSMHETTGTTNAITKSIIPSPTVAVNVFG